MTETPVRTIADIEAELVDARLAIQTAERAEAEAFGRVSSAREGHALGQLARRGLLAFQNRLSDTQETTEQAKAKVRALERLQVQQAAAQADIERQAKDARDRELRDRGAQLERRVGVALREIQTELLSCEAAIAAYHAERGAWEPNTAAGRDRAWTTAATALRVLRGWYPVVINTIKEG